MTGPALYELACVAKVYDGHPALRVEGLEVAQGEFLCLVGPSGAGKSTLLRLMAGVEPPTAGRLRFAGHPVGERGLPLEFARRITMVFQSPVLLTGTVRDNVEFGLRLRSVPRSPRRVRDLLERLGLRALASRSARSLSGGEAQRVALARALVLEPEVLLLDEPTANLDPANVALVESVVGDDHRERGTTVVWATHNIFQVRRLARRVAFLHDGELVEVAEKKDFFDGPRDPRTAAFVRGEMVY